MRNKNKPAKEFSEHKLWSLMAKLIKRNGIYTFQSDDLILEAQKGCGIVKTENHGTKLVIGQGEYDLKLMAQPINQYGFEGHLDEDLMGTMFSGERSRETILFGNPNFLEYISTRINQPSVLLGEKYKCDLEKKIRFVGADMNSHPKIKEILDEFLEGFSGKDLKKLYVSYLRKK